MGEVWRAHDTDTDRIVAIKVLPEHLSRDAEFQRRFRREAHAAARLNSPHVIPIHHYGEIDGRLYVDMRLIEGRDLSTVLAAGPLEPGRAVHVVEQIAKALHAAHRVGLMHRDIKPSNILLDDDDFAYLIDFGIARAADETRMTRSGNIIGTFAYIAPERLDPDADEDARADIYSLACVLFESLTGRPPFAGSTMAQLVASHLNTPPPRASMKQLGVPRRVDDVIAIGMAKDPNQRYATTVEFAYAARDAITVPINPTRLNPAVQSKAHAEPLKDRPPSGDRLSYRGIPTAASSVAAKEPSTPKATGSKKRQAHIGGTPDTYFSPGSWARVTASGDDHYGQIGQIDPAYQDEVHVFLQFEGESDLYAFERSEIEPVRDPPARQASRANDVRRASRTRTGTPVPPGNWARVTASGDDHYGQIGQIDPAYQDEVHVFLQFQGDRDLYAFERGEIEPI